MAGYDNNNDNSAGSGAGGSRGSGAVSGTPASDKAVEFRMLDYSTVGSDTVSFKLEDGTVVKVRVGIERVGVATNYRNPDGTLHYAVNTSVKLYIIPHDKRFTLPKSQVKGQAAATTAGPQGPGDSASRNRRGTPSHIT